MFEFEPKVHPGLVASRKTIRASPSRGRHTSHRPADPRLLDPLPAVSPHNAVLNETLRKDQEEEMLANLESYLKTGKPNTPVNLA